MVVYIPHCHWLFDTSVIMSVDCMEKVIRAMIEFKFECCVCEKKIFLCLFNRFVENFSVDLCHDCLSISVHQKLLTFALTSSKSQSNVPKETDASYFSTLSHFFVSILNYPTDFILS